MPPTIVQLAASATMMSEGVEDVDMDYRDPLIDKEESFLPQHQVALPDLARRIGSRVNRFLNLRPKDDHIKNVQEQTRASLKVVSEALDRYE
jgi:hypothetical protein